MYKKLYFTSMKGMSQWQGSGFLYLAEPGVITANFKAIYGTLAEQVQL